jgi:amidohydrolase
MNLNNIRHHLHQHPELSGNEHQTQQYIKQILLDAFQLNGLPVGNTGLLYHFNFGAGPSVLVRVDIDALPIQEENTFEHQSKNKGVAHKCGHDGHTTIGIGLIEQLVNQPLPAGQVSILFQPAEEIGEGAKAVLNDINFDIKQYQYALALHNIPGLPLHQAAWKTGTFTMAVQSIIIVFKGKNTHAASPAGGVNPAAAIAQLLLWAKENEVTDANHDSYHLITPVHANLGTPDYGIAAGYGEAHFTLRSKTQAGVNAAIKNVQQHAQQLARANNLQTSNTLVATFAANENNERVVKHFVAAAEKLNLSHQEKPVPFSWGEDFGLFTQHIPGAMFGLGSGENCPELHHPSYDFPNELIPTGINLFYETVKNIIVHE